MIQWKSIKTETYLIFGIILLGTILRFWDYQNIPFTHDEFSALKRLHFDSFTELINQGVKLDAHPAGVHVFMYYWIKVFGENEIAVKFPFLLMGIGSIWLIYRIGKSWFNATSGLVSAAFIATMQFTIMYSQIARPYISGLFVCLLMVWYWTNLMKPDVPKLFKNIIGFTLSAALCAYNHHFSLLFAAMVGVTGIFIINRKYLLQYAITGIAIFLLYLPHLSIFLYQLNIGGVEAWLAKPTPVFIIEFIKYLFHFAWYEYLLIAGIFLWGILLVKKSPPNKYYYVALIWFSIPYLIGYFYSVYVNAVLQYSVLLFSFPFLLFVITGLLPVLTSKKQLLLTGTVCVVSVSSLLFERQHYSVFYENRFKQFLIDTQTNIEELGEKNCTVLLSNHPEINQYYFKKLGLTFSFYNSIEEGKDVSNTELFKIEEYVKNANTQYLIFGGVAYGQSEIYGIVKEHYPTLVKQYNYYASNLYLFEKGEFTDTEYSHLYTNDFELYQPEWNYNMKHVADTISYSGKSSYLMDENAEFGVEFENEIDDITRNNGSIDLSVKVFFEKQVKETLLVGTIMQNDSMIHWSAGNTNNFNIQENNWSSLYHTISIRNVDITKPFTIQAYVWNKEKAKLYLDDFTVRIRNGNPLIYSLTEKINR